MAEQQQPTYGQRASQLADKSMSMVQSVDPQSIPPEQQQAVFVQLAQATAQAAAAMATLAAAQELYRVRTLVGELVKVQVPPETVPSHVYQEAIDKILQYEDTFKAQQRIKDKLDGEPVNDKE